MLSVSFSQCLQLHMSSGKIKEMGDILANEADLLGMIKEVCERNGILTFTLAGIGLHG